VNVYLRLQLTCLLLSTICCCSLCLFRVLLDICSFCFLQYTALSFAIAAFFLIYSLHGVWPSPSLRWSFPHDSCCYKPFPLQAHWGRWHHSCLLWPACLFTVHVEKCPFPPPPAPVELSSWQSLLQAFPTPKLLGRCRHSCLLWLACLFTVHVTDCLSPTLWSSGHPAVFCMCLFFSAACLLFSWEFFSFFSPWWGLVCPGGYADLPHGCLWEYHVLLSSPGGLLLPSRIGAGAWRHRSPPGFSV
jgi:hypothetical protein